MRPKKLLLTTQTDKESMWIKVSIYSVKAKTQAGSIWVKDIMATQKGQTQKKTSSGSQKCMHFTGIFSR